MFEYYPEYHENEHFYTVYGKKIIKHKTLEENGVRNSDIIILNIIE